MIASIRYLDTFVIPEGAGLCQHVVDPWLLLAFGLRVGSAG